MARPVNQLLSQNAPLRTGWDKKLWECCYVKDCGPACCCITLFCGPCAYSEAVRWISPDLGDRAFSLWLASVAAGRGAKNQSSLGLVVDALVDGGYIGIRKTIARLMFGGEDTTMTTIAQCFAPSCARCQEINELMLWYDRQDAASGRGRSVRFGNPFRCQMFVVVDEGENVGHPRKIPNAPKPLIPRGATSVPSILPGIMARF